MKKKAQITQLQPLIVALVAIAIVVVVGFLVLGEVKTQVQSVSGDTTTNNAAWNATETTIDAISDIPGWLPIIVITLIGGLLIGLVAFFRAR